LITGNVKPQSKSYVSLSYLLYTVWMTERATPKEKTTCTMCDKPVPKGLTVAEFAAARGLSEYVRRLVGLGSYRLCRSSVCREKMLSDLMAGNLRTTPIKRMS
jgi:hypothetical protein